MMGQRGGPSYRAPLNTPLSRLYSLRFDVETRKTHKTTQL